MWPVKKDRSHNSVMALSANGVPAVAPATEDLAETIGRFTGRQYRYLVALPQHKIKLDALRSIGVTRDALDKWRSTVPGFREVDDAIWKADSLLRVELARAILQEHAPKAALNLVEMSDQDAATDREKQVRYQAAVKVLEAAGVIKADKGVTVNVDSRRIDIRARQLWAQGGRQRWLTGKDGAENDQEASDSG